MAHVECMKMHTGGKKKLGFTLSAWEGQSPGLLPMLIYLVKFTQVSALTEFVLH